MWLVASLFQLSVFSYFCISVFTTNMSRSFSFLILPVSSLESLLNLDCHPPPFLKLGELSVIILLSMFYMPLTCVSSSSSIPITC
jgi:hypothetical protein